MAEPPSGVRPDTEPGTNGNDARDVTLTIDRALAQSREGMAARLDEFRPESSGVRLPAMISVVGLLAFALTAFLVVSIFDRRENQLVDRSTDILSTEGRIIAEYRRQTERELRARDSEISGLELLLSEADTARELLLSETDALLAQREDELRSELEGRLSEYRQELGDRGLANAEIGRLLAERELALRADQEAVLDSIRQEALAEAERRQARLDELRGRYEASLQEARESREALESRLADARAGAIAVPETEASVAPGTLDALGARAAEQRLILEQLSAAFELARTSLAAGDQEAAVAAVTSAETLIDATPESVLGSAVRDLSRMTTWTARELLVERGLREVAATASGDSDEIVDRLDDENSRLSARNVELESEVDNLQATVDSLQAQVAVGDSRRTALRRELESANAATIRLERASSRLDSFGGGAGAESNTSDDDAVVGLVETKLQLRLAATSDWARQRYPDLESDMDGLFTILASSEYQRGREDAARQITELINALTGNVTGGVDSGGEALQPAVAALQALLDHVRISQP